MASSSKTTAPFIGLFAVALISGCSILNSFDDLDETPPDSGDGDAQSGGSSMGGASGGADGLGGEGNSNSGSGGAEPAEPGLIVAIEGGGPFGDEDDTMYALSPQDGGSVQTDVANYYGAVHEPNRDVWFFVRNGELVAATFDRAEKEWTFHAESGPSLVDDDAPLNYFVAEFFAFNQIVVFGLNEQFRVFDTSDLGNITQIGVETNFPAGVFWAATAAPKVLGGSVNVLKKNCVDLVAGPCAIELTTYNVGETGMSFISTIDVIADFDVASFGSARGNIRYDEGTSQVVAIVPSKELLGQGFVFNPHDPVAPTMEDFSYPQPGSRMSKLTIDPCHSVVYAMDSISEDIVGVSFTESTAVPLNENFAAPGVGLTYEPHTRSLVHGEIASADFGIFAHELTGTPDAPDIRKRIANWAPPVLSPDFIAVARPATLACPN